MAKKERLSEVEITLIEEPAHVLRKKITEEGLEELKHSMAKVGLIQPIRLMRKGTGYEIESGHRRFLAAKDLGWLTIRAIVIEEGSDEARIKAIHENLHREDMSPIEEAGAIKELLERGGESIKDVARMCSKSESWVSSRLALLELSDELKEAVDVGALSVAAARELGGIVEDEARRYYTDYAIKQGATAQLCAFWRSRWEIERLTHDSGTSEGGHMVLTPPPMEVTLPCYFCERQYPIHILNHLRACPICSQSIGEELQRAKQRAIDAKREAAGEDVSKKSSEIPGLM